jgi:uroporphyrinogen-III synthase
MVAITRSHQDAAGLAKALKAQGARVSSTATIAIRARRVRQPQTDRLLASSPVWLFTSRHAVQLLAKLIAKRRAGGRHCRLIVAVGQRTAALARRNFTRPIWVAPLPLGEQAIIELMISNRTLIPNRRCLLPTAMAAGQNLVINLRRFGIGVDRLPLYQTVARLPSRSALGKLAAAQTKCMIFYSPSQVRNLAHTLKDAQMLPLKAQLAAVAIGPTTANELKSQGFKRIVVARDFGEKAVVEAVRQSVL